MAYQMRELFNEVSSSIRNELVEVVEQAILLAEDSDDFERAVRNLMCNLIINLSEEEGKSLPRDIEYINAYLSHFCVSHSRTYNLFKNYLEN